jgi:hypothetical protein
MTAVSCFPQFRGMILSILPNVVQGLFAAVGDYYTWQLAERMYGIGSRSTSAVVSWAIHDERNPLLIPPALHDNVQPVAVVLFDKDLFQLSRDDVDHHGIVLLAVEHLLGHHLGTRK